MHCIFTAGNCAVLCFNRSVRSLLVTVVVVVVADELCLETFCWFVTCRTGTMATANFFDILAENGSRNDSS